MARPGLAVTEPPTDVRGLKAYEAPHIVGGGVTAWPGLGWLSRNPSLTWGA